MAIVKSLSAEDRNLNSITRITSQKLTSYKDIDLTFARKRNGDIFKKNDAAAVKQAVKNLILTNYYEKPFQPYFGANIQGLLFELSTGIFEDDIESQIRHAIEMYEPRAQVQRIIADIGYDEYTIDVSITFKVVNTSEVVELTTQLTRLR